MRPLALARAESMPIVASVTTLVLERMLDVLTVMGLLFLSMTLPGLPSLGGSEQFAARLHQLGMLLLAGLVVLSGMVVWPAASTRIGNAAVSRLPARVQPAAMSAVTGFLAAVGGLRDPKVMFRAVAWSLVLWLVNAVGFWFAMKSFGLNYSFTAVLFFQGILVIAVAAPSAPGFFGVYLDNSSLQSGADRRPTERSVGDRISSGSQCARHYPLSPVRSAAGHRVPGSPPGCGGYAGVGRVSRVGEPRVGGSCRKAWAISCQYSAWACWMRSVI